MLSCADAAALTMPDSGAPYAQLSSAMSRLWHVGRLLAAPPVSAVGKLCSPLRYFLSLRHVHSTLTRCIIQVPRLTLDIYTIMVYNLLIITFKEGKNERECKERG